MKFSKSLMRAVILVVAPVFTSYAAERVSHVMKECEWIPNSNRFTGEISPAIKAFNHIPPETQKVLMRMIEGRQVTDQVTITRDAIVSDDGKFQYQPMIKNMLFGDVVKGKYRVCHVVTRNTWGTDQRVDSKTKKEVPYKEGAIVFCARGYCLLYAATCGNLAEVFLKKEIRKESSPPAATPILGVATLTVTDTVLSPSPSVSSPLLLEVPFVGEALPPEVTSDMRTPPNVPFEEWRVGPTRPFSPFPDSPIPGWCCVSISPLLPGVVLPPTPIPELETHILILLGLFALGVMVKYRKDK